LATPWCTCGHFHHLSRHLGIGEQTFYRWKRRYAGLESEQVRQFKLLQAENAKLKGWVADLSLDKVMLQDVLAKKMLRPSRRRIVGTYLQTS